MFTNCVNGITDVIFATGKTFPPLVKHFRHWWNIFAHGSDNGMFRFKKQTRYVALSPMYYKKYCLWFVSKNNIVTRSLSALNSLVRLLLARSI